MSEPVLIDPSPHVAAKALEFVRDAAARGRGRLIAALEDERDRWPLWIPVGVGAGIAIYFALPAEPPLWLAVAISAASLIGLTLAWRRGPGVTPWLAALAVVALGLCAAAVRTEIVAAPIVTAEIGPIRLEGRVIAAEPRIDGLRLVLDRLAGPHWPGSRPPEKVRINLRTGGDVVKPGDRVGLRATLLPPPEPAAPGAYDFARALYFRGIGAVGYALSPIRRLESSPARGSSWIAAARNEVADRILARLDGARGAVAAALLTGMRGAIPESVMANMRNSGLAHLLAISGLHMGLVAAALFFAVRLAFAAVPRLALRYPIKKWAALVALAGAAFYLLLTGATVPTQRAFVMVALVLGAVLLDRTALSMRLVAWAALAILLLHPESLLSASFQLSFAAVVLLIASYEGWHARMWRRAALRSWRGRLLVYLAGIAVTSLLATIATAPFAAYHFNRIASYGVVANLVAVPLTVLWIMPWGLLALALIPLGLEPLALTPMGWGIDAVLAVAAEVASWPGAVTHLATMPAAALALIAGGGLWLCLWRRRWRWLGLTALAAGLAVALSARGPDILVDGAGKLFAVRVSDGRLALSSGRAARFSGELWLRRNGQTVAPPWPGEAGSERLRCDRLGCIYHARGHTVALVRDPRALDEDCGRAEIVISATPVRQACAAFVIDRFDLWRDGAHGVWLAPGGFRVGAVQPVRGDRPWVVRRGWSRRRAQ